MKELMLIVCSLSIVFTIIGTWSCLVVGARSEREYREK